MNEEDIEVEDLPLLEDEIEKTKLDITTKREGQLSFCENLIEIVNEGHGKVFEIQTYLPITKIQQRIS